MGQQVNQQGMGQGKGIAIGKKQGGLALAPPGGKVEILFYLSPGFDLERFVAIGTAEGTAAMRTTEGHLQDYGKGLAGWPDNVSLVIHGQPQSLPMTASHGQGEAKS
jgi:hypothetical protein